MPGVLIELGFISNKKEAKYLGSDQGKDEIAKAIAQSILQYKEENFSVSESGVKEQVVVKEDVKSNDNVPVKSTKSKVYKVQIGSSKKKLATNPSNFKGLKNVSRTFEKGYYKYFYGSVDTTSDCEKLLAEAKKKGYDSAFIVTDIENK